MEDFSPILIPTLNRFEHFKRCVESLSRCKYADRTDLLIALDYPLKDTHWNGYNQINEYIPKIIGFKNVILIKREKNYGALENSNLLFREVLEKYDTFFFTEDDNEFSPNTLEYINLGLEKFEKNDAIFAICTSHHNIEIPNSATGTYFTLDSYSPMGFATWKYKYLKYFEVDKQKYIVNFLNDYSNFKRLKKERLHVIASMLESISKKYILADAVTTSYILINNMKCVFPMIHKVKNHGYDGSGVNCSKLNVDHPFNNRIIDNYHGFEFIEEENELALREIRNNVIRSFQFPYIKRIFILTRYFLYFCFRIQFSSLLFKKVYRLFK